MILMAVLECNPRTFHKLSLIDYSLHLFVFLSESLRDYFGRYGDISEAMVMKDPTTRRSR